LICLAALNGLLTNTLGKYRAALAASEIRRINAEQANLMNLQNISGLRKELEAEKAKRHLPGLLGTDTLLPDN